MLTFRICVMSSMLVWLGARGPERASTKRLEIPRQFLYSAEVKRDLDGCGIERFIGPQHDVEWSRYLGHLHHQILGLAVVRAAGTFNDMSTLAREERIAMDIYKFTPHGQCRFGFLEVLDFVPVRDPQRLYFKTGQRGSQSKSYFSSLSVATYARLLASGPHQSRNEFSDFPEAIRCCGKIRRRHVDCW